MGEWVLVAVGAVFLYLCVYGIVHMLRLRRRGTLETTRFEDADWGISLLYPSGWEILRREGRLEFVTRQHDGRGEIGFALKNSSDCSPEAAIHDSLAQERIELDEKDCHPFEHGPWKGAFVESRASKGAERLYLQEWVLDGSELRIHLRYRCSVLYGQIDGFDIDRTMRSLASTAKQSSQKIENS